MIISQDAYRYSEHPCTHNGTWMTYYDPETFDYAYMYDCRYFYNWEGLPIVNNRLLVDYTTLIYMIVYVVAGLIGIGVGLLAAFVIVWTKLIAPTSKAYLLSMMLLSLYFDTQFFYRAHCLYGFEPDRIVSTHTHHTFPCLNTDNWPSSAFGLNLLLSGLWYSGNFSYYFLTWSASFHRFAVFYFRARLARFVNWLRIIGIFVSFLLPAIPVYSLIGHDPLFVPEAWKNITEVRSNYFGVYFNPLNQHFNGYYMRQHYLWDSGPLLWLLMAPNIWLFLAELTLLRRAQKNSRVDLAEGWKEVNEVKQLFASHLLIFVGWLVYSIFVLFSLDLRIRITVFSWFLVMYLPWFLMALGNPYVAYLTDPSKISY